MTLQEMGAPALGVEERRDEAPRAGASHARANTGPGGRDASSGSIDCPESCTQPGEVGRLLRREGLYSSHLTAGRGVRGRFKAMTPSKRGRKRAERNLSLPFIPSIAETLEFCITTGYPFRHA